MPPPPPPPPQAANVRMAANTMALSTNSNLRRLRSNPSSDENASRLIAIAVPIPISAPGECWCRFGAMLDGAVVEIVSITLAVVIAEVKVMLVGDTLQVLSDGKPAH